MAIAWGLGFGDLKVRPNFRAERDATGVWRGSVSFQILRQSWPSVESRFVKDTPITQLFLELGSYWDFLLLESWSVEARDGGWYEIPCVMSGVQPGEFESDDDEDDTDVTYILSGTRVERSIMLHPLYRKEMIEDNPEDAVVLAQAFGGMWAIDELFEATESDIEVYNLVDGTRPNYPFVGSTVVNWVNAILRDGLRTYKAPTLQWTCETSSKEGLTEEDVAFLGLVEFDDKNNKPPGEPPVPFDGDFEWLKISLSDVRSTSSGSSTSQTWELSPPGGFPKFPDGRGVYNYKLKDLQA